MEFDPRIVVLTRPDSFESEQYLRLRQQIEVRMGERQLRVLAVTSAVVGDGKSLTAVNLAAAFARRKDARVLLVDADLRRPKVASLLGLAAGGPTIGSAIAAGSAPLSGFLRIVPDTQLTVLAGGSAARDTYELLSSGRFATLMQSARESFDYVILDTPPVIPVPDTGLLRPVVDGYLLVVSARSTPRRLLGEALNLMEPSSVVGLVFNRDDRPLFGYYSSHYHEYFRS